MFRRNSTNDIHASSQKKAPSNKAMEAISKLAKRFQRKKQDNSVISVLVTSQKDREEQDMVENTVDVKSEAGETLLDTGSDVLKKSTSSGLETRKNHETACSRDRKEAHHKEEEEHAASTLDEYEEDKNIHSFTTTPLQSNQVIEAKICNSECQQQVLNVDDLTVTKIEHSHSTDNIHNVEKTNSSVSRITDESSQITKKVDHYPDEHIHSGEDVKESPENNHSLEKKAKRRIRKQDLKAEENLEKSHQSKRETPTTDLTKKKSKNSIEVPASPVSFTRYPWEEPGYAKGTDIKQTLTESELVKEASEWMTVLATLESEWTHRVAVLKRIRLVLDIALKNHCQNIIEIFNTASMRNALILQTTDLRSSLVKEAFETIATICEQLGNWREFFLTSALFLDKAVLVAVVKTTKVIAKPADECGKRIVASTAAEAVLPVLCSTIRFGVHPTAREKSTILLLHILKRGPPLVRHIEDISELLTRNQVHETKEIQGLQYSISEFTSEDSGLRSLESALASAIGDSHGNTREAGLNCLHEMEKHWPERTQRLIQALDPSLRRRALSSLSSNSSQSTRSSAASSNRVRKSVKEWKAEAQKTRRDLEKKEIFSEEPNVIAEDSITDKTEKIGSTGQDICKGTLEAADNVAGIEHRSSKKSEMGSSVDTRKVQNHDSLRVR